MVLHRLAKPKKVWCFLLILIFLSNSIPFGSSISSHSKTDLDDAQIVCGFDSSVWIEPGGDYVIKYNPSTHNFSKITLPITESFSEIVKKALVKSPDWLENSLIHQFSELSNPEVYARLILNATKTHTDEIAFCIAHAPLGNLPNPDLILKNVEQIYTVDQYISYANIIEFNPDLPNYYSTIQYTSRHQGQSINRIIPRDIYYWYIVHPQILSETPSFIYESFWRDYVFYHNDLGYPLLLEKIESIPFLWDDQAYSQPANRDWQENIKLHPTGIEAVSYWVGKTVPFQATGDRPGQPNLIAHQHNGWCGELQRIAVAGLRSVLIPSISVCNIAEDHVWREFYDNGWHQNDNWWSDTGGTVDTPLVYADGWGKDMSSVFSWRGDGVVSDVSSRYIPSEDRINVSFQVSDLMGKPLDGMRVTALVKGLKDITWYKNKILDGLESFWSFLPEKVQELFLEHVYTRLKDRIENTSDVIDGLTISIWNYTDVHGSCTFNLGKHDEYVFLIQHPLDQLPFPFASWTAVRRLTDANDAKYAIRFPMIKSDKKPVGTIDESPSEDEEILVSASLRSKGFQYQANVRNNDIGQYASLSKISFFIFNEEEYIKYDNNEPFKSKYFKKENIINDNINLVDESYYIIVHNPNQHIHSQVKITISVTKKSSEEFITIIKPDTTTFQNPQFQVGETLQITGFSSSSCRLSVNDQTIHLPSGKWNYKINTTFWKPHSYTIKANTNNSSAEKQIKLIDSIPPNTKIKFPQHLEIIPSEKNQYKVQGTSLDNHAIKTIELSIDDQEWIHCQGTTEWMKTIDITQLASGIHHIFIKTIDKSDNQQIIKQSFIINNTEPEYNPIINSISYSPVNPTNESTITIYTNITTNPSFPIKKATIEYQIDQNRFVKPLFEYAQHPIQTRHNEDPKKNESNQPCYGCDLGRFSSDQTIRFRIIAKDVAFNRQISEWKKITIK